MNLAQWANASTLQCFGDGPGVTSLSWSTGRFEPPTLVVGGAHPIVFRYSDATRQWTSVLVLPPPGPSSGSNVLDVAWAPNVGRRFHYIASAEGSQLRIFKLSRGGSWGGGGGAGSSNDDNNGGNNSNNNGGNGGELELESTQTVQVANAWRCQWNVTGTVLASSGDRGTVQLWKADFDGNFKIVSRIYGDLSQVVASQDT